MDYPFGFEHMLTETTFVRDEKLNRYHNDFEHSVVSRHLFSNYNKLAGNGTFTVQIDRGSLPPGSTIFQTVLAEFVKRKSVEISFNIQRKQNESNAR
jgi:hypothetical protein